MCLAMIVGSYAVWNYAEVRTTLTGLQKEWRIRNWDQRIKDKINDLKDKVEAQEEAVIALKVKSRDVLRKLDNEETNYNKYDEVIRGLVSSMNQAKSDPSVVKISYCGRNYTPDTAQKTFEQWTAELLPVKKRIDFLNKQKTLYEKSIERINDSISKMQVSIQELEGRTLELATIRDTLKAQELAKELVVEVAGIDDSGVKELLHEMQAYVDEIDIRLKSDIELPPASGLDDAIKYKENVETDSDLDKLRVQYLTQQTQ
ncbi:MAG: hypothetical protein C4527_06750 [Candidatus Omnitrophota bacterium]|nr:MAG: hypothetical protein C4527_06750 [Candidatus Omnitrophota bacterium]